MAGIDVALLMIAASVALRVDDARSVSADDQAAILAALGEAIEVRSGRDSAVDKVECKKKERCVADVAERTQAEDVVFLRLLGVPTRIRVIAERTPTKFAAKKTAEIDLPRARETWGPALATLAEGLFEPQALPAITETSLATENQPNNLTTTAPVGPSEEISWAPWVAFGAGALALAVGTGFGLSSRSARNEGRSMPHTDAENEALESRAIGHGLAANILFGAAVVGVGTGVVLLVLDEE